MTDASTDGIEVTTISGPVKNYLNPQVMAALIDRLEVAHRDTSLASYVAQFD